MDPADSGLPDPQDSELNSGSAFWGIEVLGAPRLEQEADAALNTSETANGPEVQLGSFLIVPVYHYKAEFAVWVRQIFLKYQPDRVALELAGFLSTAFLQAIDRLPYPSILSYELPGELGADQTMLLPIEPSDPMAEAARSAREAGKPVHLIDQASEAYPSHRDAVLDSCCLTILGPKLWWESVRQLPFRAAPEDHEREAHMASQLLSIQRLNPSSKTLVICGAAHAQRLEQLLRNGLDADSISQAVQWDVSKLNYSKAAPSVSLFQPDLDSLRQIACEIPFLQVLVEFQRRRHSASVEDEPEVWAAPPEPPKPVEPPNPLDQLSQGQVMDSLSALLGLKPRNRAQPVKPAHIRAMADYLNRLHEEPLSFSQLMNQLGQTGSTENINLPPLPPPKLSRTFTFKQMPQRRHMLKEVYQRFSREWQSDQPGSDGFVGGDRQRALHCAVEQAAIHYHENTGEQFKRWQRQVLTQFLRNYALLKGHLLPGVFELVMGSRGVADDNFSYEMWDLLTFYPWSEKTDIPGMKIDAEQLFLGDRQVQQWTFHRRLPRMREMTRQVPVRRKPEEENSENWGDDFSKGSICSYPPEDIVIEDYGAYLQKKAIQTLSSDGSRVEPFSNSLLDGIDIRETMRNWHEKKLYVREERKIRGGVGAVVIIFDVDQDDRYNWQMTWHGEHAQESDMAFYATPKEAKIVGPGIARCEYGGLMLSYPNGRLANIWQDPYYAPHCQSKAEVLLMSAIDYTEDKYVVYVASAAPRSHLHNLASKLGKKIVYIPIGQLSPTSIKKIRVFHVLSSHRKREIAKDYIW
jgi:hypothetical protein